MKKICFVCLGNICRSPMAEFMMKDIVKKRGLENEYLIESRATSYEEEGNDMYPPAKELLMKENIPFSRHYAKRLEKEDYKLFDVFYCMDDSNIVRTINIFKDSSKVKKLLDRNIADPWYTGNFKQTFKDLEEGILLILDEK